MSLKSIYSMLDSYQFPLVHSSVQCLCDCPGGHSQCDSQTNMCANISNCASYYNPSVRSSGCFFNFLHLSAAMCCSIQVKQLALPSHLHILSHLQVQPSSRELFRAVRLGVPSVLAQFETVLKNEKGEVVDTRMFNIDLNSGIEVVGIVQ